MDDLPVLTAEIIAALVQPFPIAEVEIRPGAVSEDGTSALALPYADWRCYAQRLDAVVGPAGWSIQLIPWGERRIIARLTILGVSKDSTGEADPADPNCGTIAEAQAKKRACAEFGLGRYLYLLPRVYGRGSRGARRDFRFDRDEPRRCLTEMYRRAGLLDPSPETAVHDHLLRSAGVRSSPPQRQDEPATPPTQLAHPAEPAQTALMPPKLAAARTALQHAEERAARHAPRLTPD